MTEAEARSQAAGALAGALPRNSNSSKVQLQTCRPRTGGSSSLAALPLPMPVELVLLKSCVYVADIAAGTPAAKRRLRRAGRARCWTGATRWTTSSTSSSAWILTHRMASRGCRSLRQPRRSRLRVLNVGVKQAAGRARYAYKLRGCGIAQQMCATYLRHACFTRHVLRNYITMVPYIAVSNRMFVWYGGWNLHAFTDHSTDRAAARALAAG